MSQNASLERATRGLRRSLVRAGFHGVLWLLVAIVLFPLIWPLLTALNDVSVESLVEQGPLWWLRGVDFVTVRITLEYTPFPRYLANSVLVSTVVAVLSAAFAVTAAYGIDRFDFTGRRLVLGFLLVIPMVPQAIVVIPLSRAFRFLGLLNSHVGLIVAYLALTLPFTIWLLRPLVAAVPEQLEEAAMIDGCTQAGAFSRVFLPVAKPSVATAFAFAWFLAYNEFLFALVLINDPSMRTLPVGYRYGVGDTGVAAVLATLPVLALFALLWRYFLADDVGRYVG